MRKEIKEFNVYSINELSKESQIKAWESWRNSEDYFSAEENEQTLRKFEKIFPVIVRNWNYDGYGDFINFEMFFNFEDCEEGIENFDYLRLHKYIINNYWEDLFKGKYYFKDKYVNGKYEYVSKRSKVIYNNDCVLTGFYMDMEILSPIYEFINKPYKTTFRDLMEKCLNEWLKACQNDYEYYFSFDSFKEMATSNDWEYLENGKQYF